MASIVRINVGGEDHEIQDARVDALIERMNAIDEDIDEQTSQIQDAQENIQKQQTSINNLSNRVSKNEDNNASQTEQIQALQNGIGKKDVLISQDGNIPGSTGIIGKMLINMLNGNTFLEVPLNGLSPAFHQLAFMQDVNKVASRVNSNDTRLDAFEKTLREAANAIILEMSGTGIVATTEASDKNLINLKVFGKTIQNETPTPELYVPLTSPGDSGVIGIRIDGPDTYQPLLLNTPNGLPGIQVNVDGNYTDEYGRQWICDEIDLERGIYIQRCKKVTFNGSENWYLYSRGTDQYTTFKNTSCFWYSQITDKALGYGKSLCSHFQNNDHGYAFSADYAQHGMYSDHPNYPYIYFAWGAVGQTLEEWKAWVKAQYDAGTPLELIYILAEPVETALSSSEISVYKALTTYKSNTVISNSYDNAYMQVMYIADTKAYVDKFISALNTVKNEHTEKFIGSWRYISNTWLMYNFDYAQQFNVGATCIVKVCKNNGEILMGRADITSVDSDKVTFASAGSTVTSKSFSTFDIYLTDSVFNIGFVFVAYLCGETVFEENDILQIVELH